MSTYHVTHAFADKHIGDTVHADEMSAADLAYLLQTGAIVPTDDVQPAVKRAKKVTTKSED